MQKAVETCTHETAYGQLLILQPYIVYNALKKAFSLCKSWYVRISGICILSPISCLPGIQDIFLRSKNLFENAKASYC